MSKDNIVFSEEDYVIITGRVWTGGTGPNGNWIYIEERGRIRYSIYPPEKEDELRDFNGYLIEFTAIILNEPLGYRGTVTGRTLTPVSWKVIDGPMRPYSPEPPPFGPMQNPPVTDIRKRDEPVPTIDRAGE